ncbi:MAG TPA: DNA polymerase III subunit beta [Candidatus Cryptobacteroides excrementigallinarum]|nr:DNA polymerase III subunit beta [Candidatus Cryptobacteroides excrementigallinarum]
MEFNVSSADLLKGLSDVAKAIPAKTTLPILENFLFALDGDKLQITASDQELTLRTAIAVQNAGENDSIAVPSRQMMELLKTLPDQPVTVKTTSESSFECIWGNGNSSLPFFPAADYPEIKGAGEDAMKAVFPAQVLGEGIGYTVYATADEEMRPVMNGIYFDLDPEGSTLVATDAQKLIAYSTKEARVDEKSSFILHKKAANVLRAAIDKRDDEVTAAFDSNTVEFRFGDSLMICRLIVGKFPDYRRVIPQNNSNILKIDRLQLLNAVRRVSVCANRASNHIKFELRPGQLEITAQDLGFALAAYEKIACEYNGDELGIGFKSPHILDMVGNMQSDSIVMKFADARRAALILPSEEEEESGKICGILMPIMIS